MKIERFPSRSLNDQRGVLGLWVSDFFAALVIFCVWARVFEDTPIALFGVPVATVCLILVAPLRLATRRKMIRDSMMYFLSGSVVYDPKVSRTARYSRFRKNICL